MKNNIFLTSDAATVLHDVVKYFDYKKNNKILFVDTSGETHIGEKEWITQARKKLVELGFEVCDYTITDKTEKDVRDSVSSVDIVYVAGGDSAYLLKKSQESNFAAIIREFIAASGIYIGQSAGSIVAGPCVLPVYKPSQDEWFSQLDNLDGFNVVDFVIFPHFGRADKREKFLQHRFKNAYSDAYKIILLTDKQYIRVQEDGMYKIEEVSEINQ